MNRLVAALRTIGRVLAFRFDARDVEEFDWTHLAVGLFFTWLAGMGRYWDNPRAVPLQHLGVGSVIYVFVLATYLFLFVWPLSPERWSFRKLLTFVTLTSPPALLYAIPVERWMSLEAAQSVNLWFLAAVAVWRVALYSLYLRRWCLLTGWVQACATLLPLALIVAALTFLNLEHVVFNMMAGNEWSDPSPADDTYGVLKLLTVVSFLLSPFLFVLYVVAVSKRESRRLKDRE